MASLRKHSKSKNWYACITLPDGKQRQFSTGLADEDEARAVAVAAERAVRKLHHSPSQLREALDRIVNDFVPAEEFDPSPWLVAWAKSRKAETSVKTAETYANTMAEAAEWLTAEGVVSFKGLTSRKITELRNHWAEKNMAPTVNTKLKHLRIALKVAVGEKLIEDNPAVGVKNLKTKDTVRREFRPAELALLVPTLTGEWRGMFFLGINTGQRLNDLALLKCSQVDLVEKTVTLQAAKTKATVCLPLLDDTLEALKGLKLSVDPNAFVFPEIAKGKDSSRSNAFRAILAKVGLARPLKHRSENKDGPRVMSELSFHSLRHTATSMLKKAGVSDSIARAIIGHESAAISRLYTHLDMETMRTALEKMPKI